MTSIIDSADILPLTLMLLKAAALGEAGIAPILQQPSPERHSIGCFFQDSEGRELRLGGERQYFRRPEALIVLLVGAVWMRRLDDEIGIVQGIGTVARSHEFDRCWGHFPLMKGSAAGHVSIPTVTRTRIFGWKREHSKLLQSRYRGTIRTPI